MEALFVSQGRRRGGWEEETKTQQEQRGLKGTYKQFGAPSNKLLDTLVQ